MTTFPLHTPDTAPEGSRTTLAAAAKAWGFVPNLHAVLAESPVALVSYDTLFGLIGESSLSPLEAQVAFLTVSVFHGCEYCTMGHTYLARSVGIPEDEIQRLRAGTLPQDPHLAALSRFVTVVLQTRGRAGAAAVDGFLAAGFSQANVLDVVTVIATKTISNYVNHLTGTPKEAFMADPSFAWTAPAIAAE